MLGHKVFQAASRSLDAWATIRREELSGPAAAVLDPDRLITEVRAEEPASIERAIASSDADVVINCIGVIKQSATAQDPVQTIGVNSLFPHQAAALCSERGKRFVHISTDCVFSGQAGNYTEEAVSDAEDLYGRSKFLGEVTSPGSLTVRTSIIGRELETSYGLVEWFLGEAGKEVRGFSRAIFSGLSTVALADLLVQIVTEQGDLEGLWHVSCEPIDKLALLELLRDAYGISLEIVPDDALAIDRSLDSSRFREATGWTPPAWPEMIAAMAADEAPYEEIRSVPSA